MSHTDSFDSMPTPNVTTVPNVTNVPNVTSTLDAPNAVNAAGMSASGASLQSTYRNAGDASPPESTGANPQGAQGAGGNGSLATQRSGQEISWLASYANRMATYDINSTTHEGPGSNRQTGAISPHRGSRVMELGNKERSLVSKVMDGLISGIVEERYGAILPPQDVLSKEFDVSRTVMREALSMLLARHMLDVRPKIGTRIRPMRDWRMIDEDVVNWRFRAKPDNQFLRDVIEFRALIEPAACALAAVRANAADVAGIRDAFDALRQLGTQDPGFQAADALLHTRILAASGNQFYQQMAAIMRGALSLVNPVINQRDGGWANVLAAHERVVQAIERRAPDEAEAASRAMIEFTADELNRAFATDALARHEQPLEQR